ncbi:hypothetical protein [Neobittarella massiliensis]|uniref:hypothetical protein n=1 Tax=Neobittarella massiliensis (ex Bilen et al. 2018) TaxID=2041842 RepID=UPI000CF70A4B|nr:hypothetical protein [Neobittarella massiliensis]
MSNSQFGCLIAGLLSVVFGGFIAYAFYQGDRAFISLLAPFILVLSFIMLMALLYTAVKNASQEKNLLNQCMCGYGKCLIVTTAVTFLLSLLLAILIDGSLSIILTTVIVGLWAAFLAAAIMILAMLLSCVFEARCPRPEPCYPRESDYRRESRGPDSSRYDDRYGR